MSMDKSLKGKDTLVRHRNVLTRAERIQQLQESDRWSDDSAAIGLPKLAHRKAAVGKKDKEKKEEQAEPGEEPAKEGETDKK